MLEMLKTWYGLTATNTHPAGSGVGGQTWIVTCEEGKYVVKCPEANEINHPQREYALCQRLLTYGVPASRFLTNKQGDFLTHTQDGKVFHVQEFIEGKSYDFNTAPKHLLLAQAKMLGQIHRALKDFPELPEGIGAGFFSFMTPQRAKKSYEKSLQIARQRGDTQIEEDLSWRIQLLSRLTPYRFDAGNLTCQGTHGDYVISQLICGENEIRAVIDWTSACVHPVIWEIIRSYVYAAPSCTEGMIDPDEFSAYVRAYLEEAPLTKKDMQDMAELFFYQLAVCDYYGQYYASQAQNRDLFLHQAQFSTKLMRHLEHAKDALGEKLAALL